LILERENFKLMKTNAFEKDSSSSRVALEMNVNMFLIFVKKKQMTTKENIYNEILYRSINNDSQI